MEIIDRIIVSLIHYNAQVRDTLEYTLNREQFDSKIYEERKRILKTELEVNSPLKIFLEQRVLVVNLLYSPNYQLLNL